MEAPTTPGGGPQPPEAGGAPAPAAAVPAQTGEKPNGPICAALYALGIGAFALGLLTTLAEASTWVHDKLEFKDSVGPLSGKTDVTVAVFIVAWLVGHYMLRERNANVDTAVKVALVGLILGLIGTFPTFFRAFA